MSGGIIICAKDHDCTDPFCYQITWLFLNAFETGWTWEITAALWKNCQTGKDKGKNWAFFKALSRL